MAVGSGMAVYHLPVSLIKDENHLHAFPLDPRGHPFHEIGNCDRSWMGRPDTKFARSTGESVVEEYGASFVRENKTTVDDVFRLIAQISLCDAV